MSAGSIEAETAQAQRAAGGAAWAPAAPAAKRALRRIYALDDFEVAARRRLPQALFGFISGGTETNASLRANRAAFADWVFVPRVLVDASRRNQSVSLFGQTYATPFGIAPMGASALMAYDADCVLAEAAEAANIPFILSGASLTPLERVRRAGRTSWFQAYIPSDRAHIGGLIARVADAGYEVLVVTVDVQVPGNRENNQRAGFSLPLRPTPKLLWDGISHPGWLFGTAARTLATRGMLHFENAAAERGGPVLSAEAANRFAGREALDWDDLAFIREKWRGKLVLKGVLAPEDANRARALGVDGVMVSNHGGRQLDGAIAALHALPAVVAAAGPMTVMLDGGVRRGTDVLKALALGAKFVFVARPFLYAAAVAGRDGAAHAIRLLASEIDRDLALLGCPEIASLSPDWIAPAGMRANLPRASAG
ncbi:MAG: alpha-hydroxy-acid oxidizing protein [Acidobacteriia bacterium]|nr:alpha-hydroxy-acid oxidizing protein [Methyloceanibacter sp.]MBX5471845.1 alpha-hydroxy-acid oxidizing protein [Acetobacteraceae bacterium]MCL6491494.1 alpha-hydroxy-acid oxidizing protein [Terriglobia bacterium]